MTDKEKEQLVDEYMERPYGVILRKDEEDMWVASIIELDGCMAHGDTPEAALQLLNDVKRTWIEDFVETGDPLPEPKVRDSELPSGKWLQRVPRTLHGKLVAIAENEGVSLNQFVTSVLSEAVGIKSAHQERRKLTPTNVWVVAGGQTQWEIDQPQLTEKLEVEDIKGLFVVKNAKKELAKHGKKEITAYEA